MQVMCFVAMIEVITYYMNIDSNINSYLVDAIKAFDMIHYDKWVSVILVIGGDIQETNDVNSVLGKLFSINIFIIFINI